MRRRRTDDAVTSELPAEEAAALSTEHAVQRARLIGVVLATGITWSLAGLTLDPRLLVGALLALTAAVVAVGLATMSDLHALHRLGAAAFAGDTAAIVVALWLINTNPADPIWAITGLLAIEAAARWGARGAVLGGVLSASLAGWWATMAYAADDRELSVESLVFRGVVLLVLALPAGRLIDQLRREQARARQLYEASTELILILDDSDHVVSANPAAGQLLGQPSAALRGVAVRELLPGIPPVIELLATTAGGHASSLTLQAPDRPPRTLAVTAQPSAERSTIHLIGRDVTTERSREAQLRHQALHDVLTGLPNRTALQERIDAELAAGAPFGLLFLDLDDFKTINDTYGHGFGDRVLAQVAERLRNAVRTGDVPYRLAGDEFCVVVAPASAATLDSVAERVAAALSDTIEVEGREVATSASVGVGLAGPDDDRDHLLARADAAMYVVKAVRSGRTAGAAETAVEAS